MLKLMTRLAKDGSHELAASAANANTQAEQAAPEINHRRYLTRTECRWLYVLVCCLPPLVVCAYYELVAKRQRPEWKFDSTTTFADSLPPPALAVLTKTDDR